MFQTTTTMSRDRRRQAHQHLSSKMSVRSPDGALAVDRRVMYTVVVVLLFLSAAVSSSSSSTSPFQSSRSDNGNHLLNDGDDSLRQPASYTRGHRLHRSRHNVTSTTLESAIDVVPDGRTVTISMSPRPEVRAASAIWRPQTETKRPSQGHTPKGSKFIGANTRQTESFYRRNRRSVAAMHVENTATTIPSIPATTTVAMFGGLPEADVGQLDELIGRDPAAAVLEFNERVLAVGISSAKSCSMKLRYESAMDPKKFANIFKEQLQSVLQTANTLNNALVVTDPSSLSDSFYLALVKGLVSSDRLVYGAIIVLEPAHGNGNVPSQTPYVFKDPSTGHLQVRYVDVVRDVSRDLSSPNSTDEFAWFLRLRQNRYTDLLRYHKNVCRGGGHQSSSSMSSAAGSSAASSSSLGQSAAAYATSGTQVTVVTTAKEGLWGSPHFNCAQARSWIVALSVPFFGCIPQGVGLRGVLKVDLNLGKVDINQCSSDSRQLFSATHRCPPDTQCIHLPNGGFRRGNYRCDCLTGFYPTPRGTTTSAGSISTSEVVSSVSTSSKSDTEDGDEGSGDIDDGNVVNRSMSAHLSPASATGINGSLLEQFHVEYMLKDIRRSVASASTALADRWRCVECRCPPTAGSDCGADIGDGSGSCYVGYDALLRGIPLAVQSLCVTVTLILTVVIVRLRKTKVMKASFWCFLEVVLVGALMLYATVIIQYFEPTNATCLLIPWLREVGFAVIYGALVLKVYRVLAEFQSRKAHRVQIRDKDLFKYLLCILVVVIGYMAAWTAVTLDYVGQHGSMLQTGVTSDYLIYVVCQSKWWDYVVETAELLFMCFSIYVCYCTRAAPSNYREVRYISWTIYNEAIVSTVFYTTRHVFWLYVHPDYIFLMYFVRCQLTVTVMLLLVLGPKLWYSRRPLDDDSMRGRAYSTCEGGQDSAATPGTGLVESGKIGAVLNVNGDVDVGEINLSEMNPEDIRCELKRLYTQLQIYKTKTMRLDNPHISKRRGGRKQTHRRFSLQAFHSKHKYGGHHGDRSSAGSGAGGGGHGGGACGEHSVIGGETEVSRSPEDSVNSQEGVSVYADENSVAEMRSPTVTFKPGHRGKHTS